MSIENAMIVDIFSLSKEKFCSINRFHTWPTS